MDPSAEIIIESKIDNPIGLDGFEFIEFATNKPEELYETFSKFGFQIKARHRTKHITLMTQGDINLFINYGADSYAHGYANKHGHSIMAQGYRVRDSKLAYLEALRRGAKAFEEDRYEDITLPAIHSVNGALIYFVDKGDLKKLYRSNYVIEPSYQEHKKTAGLSFVDHLDHNVYQGHLEKYEKLYKEVLNFREVRYWDIKGEQTGITSKAFLSPCEKILIPIVESSVGNSYVQEYLDLYQGEGVQHLAFYTHNICETVEYLREQGQGFLEVKDSYYDDAQKRLPSMSEDLERIKRNHVLVDGDGSKYMMQIFTTKDLLNPIFFEFIQRSGYQGFGEKNFPALFECLEEDQKKRGVI